MPANLVWMDLEMTGLDPERDVILEMATIVTDGELNVIAEGPVLAIRQPEELLAAMDEWNQTHHSASGLLDRVRKEGVLEREAEAQTLAFMEQHAEARTAPLCGNTIWQDRRFPRALHAHPRGPPALPQHRRQQLEGAGTRAGGPALLQGFVKKNAHTALADIRESIEELKFYREHFIRLE